MTWKNDFLHKSIYASIQDSKFSFSQQGVMAWFGYPNHKKSLIRMSSLLGISKNVYFMQTIRYFQILQFQIPFSFSKYLLMVVL